MPYLGSDPLHHVPSHLSLTLSLSLTLTLTLTLTLMLTPTLALALSLSLSSTPTRSALRILQLKKTLGLLVPSATATGSTGGPTLVSAPPLPLHQPFVDSVGAAADRAASLALARESIVLLKNEPPASAHAPRDRPLLPLDLAALTSRRLLVVGPTAHSVRLQTGGWSGHWQGLSREDEVPLAETCNPRWRRLRP